MRGGRSLSLSNEGAEQEQFRLRFDRLRSQVDLHPAERTAAATLEAAARAARTIAAECLPLGIAIVMHLYPLCALRCVPLPWWSQANVRRALLLRVVDRRSLILANAGSERTGDAHQPVTLARTHRGVSVSGDYEYVSLANVADVVLFSAPLASDGSTVFCAAELRGSSVSIGEPRFQGSMRLSDTCSVSFANHHVPDSRCLGVPGDAALQCMAQYQRSWFQLLLVESYLARIEILQHQWNLDRPMTQLADLNELACMREYALRLLDDAASPGAVESLARVSAAMKLRISWHAQSTAAALRGIDETSSSELGYCRRQPTSDDRILRSLGAAPQDCNHAGYQGANTRMGSSSP